MRSARRALLCLVAVAGLMAPAPSLAGETEDAAIAAARSWLALVDSGSDSKSWAEAAAYFKGAVSESQWAQQIRAVRGPLGAVRSREVTAAQHMTSLPGAPDGEYVVIQLATSFANKAKAVETVTPMKDPDGTWRVSGYYVR